MTVRAVVFDIGNVLIRWRPEAALAELYPDPAAARAAMDAVGFAAWNLKLDAGADWDAMVAEGAAAHPAHAGLFAAYRDGLGPAHAETIPETVALLERLRAAGVPLHALTNASERTVEIVRARHPFMAAFGEVIVSGAEGVLKPERAIYDVLLKRIGLPAAEVVFVDDSPRNVEGARAAGLGAILFEGAGPLAVAFRAYGLPT